MAAPPFPTVFFCLFFFSGKIRIRDQGKVRYPELNAQIYFEMFN